MSVDSKLSLREAMNSPEFTSEKLLLLLALSEGNPVLEHFNVSEAPEELLELEKEAYNAVSGSPLMDDIDRDEVMDIFLDIMLIVRNTGLATLKKMEGSSERFHETCPPWNTVFGFADKL